LKTEELIAYGKKLKKIRQDKKLDLKKISEQTKININYLKDIEEGKFDFLPELYVRSFLKLYIQQLGEDTVIFLNEYDSFKSEEHLKVRIVTDEELKDIKKGGHFRSQISTIIEKVKPYIRQMNIIWLVGGVIIIFLVIYSMSRKESTPPIISAGSTGKSLIEHQKVILDTIPSVPYANNIFNKEKDLNLQLKALERTWLQISVDDSVAQEHIFDGGTTFNWRAKEKFRLRIGNAAGIRLILNGKDLGSLGKSGQVIRFDLTEEGIQNRFL
jgi:transcriptional regulator with XRE-family HTH domain